MNRYSLFNFLRPKRFMEMTVGSTVRLKQDSIRDVESYRQEWYKDRHAEVTSIEHSAGGRLAWVTIIWNGQERPEVFEISWLEVVNE